MITEVMREMAGLLGLDFSLSYLTTRILRATLGVAESPATSSTRRRFGPYYEPRETIFSPVIHDLYIPSQCKGDRAWRVEGAILLVILHLPNGRTALTR